MSQNISKSRKFMFYCGTAMMALGVILFILPFFFFMLEDLFFVSFILAPFGFVMIIVGAILRMLGSKGLAGSGFILNPNKAREDLKPHTEALGGVIDDVLSNTNIVKNSTQIVMVRCTKCETLNPESSKFCNQCGEKI